MDWEYARSLLHATELALQQPIEGSPERIAGAYQERARKLARPPAPADTDLATTSVLVFHLGDERYGIELADVSTVLGPMRHTPVPESPPHLEGLINVNGMIRPVLNLRFLLNIPAPAPNVSTNFILLRQKQRELSVRVDEIERVRRISLTDLHLPGRDSVARCIRGFTADTLALLCTSALFSEFWNEGSEL